MKRILIYDNDIIIAMHLTNVITEMGYHVVGTATGGQEAVCLVKRLRPDLVLADIKAQSGLSGFKTVVNVCSVLNIPVLAVTADDDAPNRHKRQVWMELERISIPFTDGEIRRHVSHALAA